MQAKGTAEAMLKRSAHLPFLRLIGGVLCSPVAKTRPEAPSTLRAQARAQARALRASGPATVAPASPS